MDFEAAIFDLDGTLLHSMDVWEKIDIDFLHKRGFDVPDHYITEISALSFEDAARYTIDLFGLTENVDAIIEEWNAMIAFEYANNIRLAPTAFNYLLSLKSMGVKLAVATALPETLYKPCLINNAVYSLFNVLCSTEQVSKGKEHPDIFLLAAKNLNIIPQKCIVFEDVLPAVKSAKQAGMIVYGVYDKYSAHHRHEIEMVADGYLIDFQTAPFPNKGV